MQSLITLGDDDADQIDVTGEIYRTVSGEVNLPDGVNIREIDIKSGSTWYDWTTSITTVVWGTDSSYTRDSVSNYYEFNITN
jgi:hypothetical protein